MRALGAPALALALAAGLVRAANTSTGSNGDTLYAPTTPPIVFFWATQNETSRTIPQCASFPLFTTESPTTAVQPVLPLYFTAAAVGYPPETQLVEGDIGTEFAWTANYPVGTQLLFAMTDSGNNSGGAVNGYTIVPGSTNCTLASNTNLLLSFGMYPEDRPCDEVVLNIQGGVRPFDVSVFAPVQGAYMNATGVQERSFNLRNVVPAGQPFHLFVSDSNGSSTAVSSGRTSALNQPGCNSAVRPMLDSSTSVGTIVGAVIGSVLGALLVALLAWWFVRRRNRRRAERYRQRPPAATSEFRTADGRAPLVEPFRIPMGGAPGAADAAGDTYDDSSPNTDSYDKSLSYPLVPDHPSPQSQRFMHAGAGGHPAPPTPQLYDAAQPNTYAHPYSGYDPAPYPAAGATRGSYDPVSTSPSSAGEYLSSPARAPVSPLGAGAPAREGTDGLAHPAEFEYRLPGESPTGPPGMLPPWAQQQGAAPALAQQAYGLPPGARPY
ncbi:hypothetical protein JCM3770_007131 [Rhodotorula araucariae]